MKKDKYMSALIKKALGYKDTEESEEYAMVDGQLQLTKRKTNTKVYPPDLAALTLLIDKADCTNNTKYAGMTLEQLQQEKVRLLGMLAKEDK